MSMSTINQSQIENMLYLENKTDNNYILEYKTDKENYIFLLSGDNRVIKTKMTELNCKLSSMNNNVKDFSFFAEVPGNYFIIKSNNSVNNTSFDVLFDIRNGNKINLRPSIGMSQLNPTSSKRCNAEKFYSDELNKSSNLYY